MLVFRVDGYVKCKAAILKDDPTENHGTFHKDCYDQWMAELYTEAGQTIAPVLEVKVTAQAA